MTMKVLVLFIMIFLHIVDDFYLQGILAKLKQRSWWEENYPNPMYRNDYKVALVVHAFSWTFMIMLPLMVIMVLTKYFTYLNKYIGLFEINIIMHVFIDHLKANVKKISLLTDQLLHLVQIITTFGALRGVVEQIKV